MRFFDSHTHAHFLAFAEDHVEVMERARVQGVGMLTVGTLPHTNAGAIACAEKNSDVWAAVGIHPAHVHPLSYHDAHELPEGATHHGIVREDGSIDLSDVEQYLTHPKVVAVGEFGLDYYRLPENTDDAERIKQEQQRAARAHLALCTEYSKPAVIHCRDAHADMVKLIEAEIARGGLARRGVIHCFTGTQEEADRYVAFGFFISFSGIVTFAKQLQGIAQTLPASHLLVETDAPYLAPVPYRGKRNEPAYVVETARFLASIRNEPEEAFFSQLLENSRRVFGGLG